MTDIENSKTSTTITTDKDDTSNDNNNNNVNIEDKKSEEPPVCVFKKQMSSKPRNMRKRSNEPSIQEDTSTSEADAIKKLKSTTQQPKINQYSTTDNIKKSDFSFQSSGTAKASLNEADLTTTIIEKDENEKEEPKGTNDDGFYRGMNAYSNYLPTKSDTSFKGAGVKGGPTKATSSNYRMSAKIDYQPDVCKDYKETGQCTFGDACKFLHDRGDYKQGWQVDIEYEAQQREKRLIERGLKRGEVEKDAKEKVDEFPFACFICRKEYENPVMTKCKHFFCENCALQHNAKSKKCFICGEPTQGTFSQPKKQIDKLIAISRAHFKSLENNDGGDNSPVEQV
eukprot:gene2053-2531_t